MIVSRMLTQVLVMSVMTAITHSPTAKSQTLTTELHNSVEKSYYAIKKIRVLYPLGNYNGVPHAYKGNTLVVGYGLAPCSMSADFGLGPNISGVAQGKQLSILAYSVLSWKRLLTQANYPEASWRPLLVGYEDSQIRYIRENPGQSIYKMQLSFQASLAQSLDEYRKKSHANLFEIIDDGDGQCGAASNSYKLEAHPPDGRVMLITEFAYKLCRALNINPDNMNTCDRWWLASTDVELSGHYRFQVSWPGGSMLPGIIEAEHYKDGATILFNKP